MLLSFHGRRLAADIQTKLLSCRKNYCSGEQLWSHASSKLPLTLNLETVEFIHQYNGTVPRPNM